MKFGFFTAIFFLAIAITSRADQAVEDAQRVLKDQGFYYGEVNGVKDADTGAAIRRYQIRSGLQVNGELNSETVTSLRSAGTKSNTASVKPTPADSEAGPDDATAAAPQTATQSNQEVNEQPRVMTPPDAQLTTPLTGAGIFAGTPFETAPPQIQRSVISDAQDLLARRGYYRGEIDGAYGPSTEFALRAYQSQAGMQPSGSFDMATLTAMQLLPNHNVPRRMIPRRPYALPPLRGEWIRE